jgi:uncharacterized membrane protein
MNIEQLLLLIITTLCAGLITGLLYTFEIVINPSLAQLDDKIYIRVMQTINKIILNPLFFVSFMGTLLLLPITTAVFWETNMRNFILLSTCLYVIGVFGVTVTGNIPLNNKIASYQISSNQDKAMRQTFETPWNRYHTIRTIASILSFICIVVAITISN